MIYIGKPERVEIYINTARKTAAQIKAETGCTALINGGLYDMSTFKPVRGLIVDGKLQSYNIGDRYGLAWDVNIVRCSQNDMHYKNFIACVCLVRDGKAIEQLDYDAGMGGARQRSAMGVMPDDSVWLYATHTGTTPEQLRQIALEAGVKHAIMLDGGGSAQCIFPDGRLNSSRIVHNYICVWDAEASETTTDEATETTTNKGVDTMFKIALDAGHGIKSANRCMKKFDPNETREWWLNDRVCDYVESYLKEYEGYSLLRVDDSDDGSDDTALASRVYAANQWGADVYISVHHNAGANGTTAGGIVVYSNNETNKDTVAWRDEMYAALIKRTGLKGNRWRGTLSNGFYVLAYTKMPAVLLELGFMDSSIDVPIILTNEHAQKCARAIVDVIVNKGKLKKKEAAAAAKPEVLYKVQLGAFANKANADALAKELNAKGYQTYIVQV